MKLSEVKPYLAFNGLFKGDAGTGKTPAALSFPTKILFLDTDYRANSLTTFFKYDRDRLKNIEVIQPTHFNDVVVPLEKIWEARRCEFSTIVLDTLTTFSDLSIGGAISEKGGSAGRKIGTVLVPGLQDFGDEAAIINRCCTLLRLIYQKMRINTILIAHVVTAEERDITKKEVVYTRSLITAGKKIGSKLPAYFDEVYHFEVRAKFGTEGKPRFFAKTRHTGFDFARTGLDLPDEIEFTNYERLPGQFFYKKIEPALLASQEDYENALKLEDKTERQESITVKDDTIEKQTKKGF